MPVGAGGIEIPPGPGAFRFAGGRGKPPMNVYYHRPPGLPDTAPVVFVMHGVKRDADVYRDTWSAAAERLGFLLFCPEFSKAGYSRRAYQLGSLVDAGKRPLPQGEWSFQEIEDLFEAVRESTGNASAGYHIYGHSAGAQFVHRMALFMPGARFETAVAANAGWYTMPEFGGRFPYGLRRSPATPETLGRAFGRRLVVLLGERDTDAADPHLRNSAAARRQGPSRLQRGRAFHAAARAGAGKLGVPLRWELQTVPGAAHFDHQMAPTAARVLLADPG